MAGLSDEQLSRLTPEQLTLLATLAKNQRYNKLDFWTPFEKQWDFIRLGMLCAERCLFAGNQVGKSEIGAYEMTVHLTGLYPPNWPGYRFDHPIEAWACGVSTTVVRDVMQTKLCGKPGVTEEFGTGMIPRHLFVGKPTLARGAVADSYDMASVRHVSGGVSQLWFKSYEQGREKFQGPPRHAIWWDEEPPAVIYSEGLARLTATRGICFLTFTPLLALSDVVLMFTKDQGIGVDWHGAVVGGRGSLRMDFLDNPNYTQEDYERKKRDYPSNEWDARLHGLPVLGAGRVFSLDVDRLLLSADFVAPDHWRKIWGCDFGINERHPFAGVLCAHDVDEDGFYVLREFKMSDAFPWMHAERFRTLGGGIPIAWPADGHARAKDGVGDELVMAYRQLGLPMLGSHATWPEGGYETERAVLELNQRIVTGRLKVHPGCRQWIDEYGQYHRDPKTYQVVKIRDDLLSSTMKALMMKRSGKPGPIGMLPGLMPTYARRNRVRRVGEFNLLTGEPI